MSIPQELAPSAFLPVHSRHWEQSVVFQTWLWWPITAADRMTTFSVADSCLKPVTGRSDRYIQLAELSKGSGHAEALQSGFTLGFAGMALIAGRSVAIGARGQISRVMYDVSRRSCCQKWPLGTR
ncbi:hypothetical protein K7B09_10670 [Thermomonas sp. RSS23]|uniref:Uncharacterized protein n=1 Tax=Thermomonas beijingensis TaxID=2872701 RepID=A0ABS7TG07_9GAMM|nr:hypothetical protein [Thermomonas beijingensis]